MDESAGGQLRDVWTDIPPINSQAQERLGYPTQKPVALLERIIAASSNPGDVVLDPFCGCGTAVHAAQKLGRQWIGIDITHLAISLIEKRLKDAFGRIQFEVHGTPKDLGARATSSARDQYQFQWWAVSLVNAVPYGGKKKGADGGIDGFIYFKPDGKTTEKAVVSVKGGEHVDVKMVRDLATSSTARRRRSACSSPSPSRPGRWRTGRASRASTRPIRPLPENPDPDHRGAFLRQEGRGAVGRPGGVQKSAERGAG